MSHELQKYLLTRIKFYESQKDLQDLYIYIYISIGFYIVAIKKKYCSTISQMEYRLNNGD